MRVVQQLSILTGLSLLIACVTADWDKLNRRLATWPGASEDNVLLVYGVPSREKETSSGMKVQTFTSQSMHSDRNWDINTGEFSSGGSYSLSCQVNFFLKDSKVIEVKYTGNWGECEGFVRSNRLK